MVKLIKSLHHRHGLRRSTIYATCLDILGAEGVNVDTMAEYEAFIDAAFTACPPEVTSVFEEQSRQEAMLSAAKSKRVLSSDNVITGYFQ